MKIAINLPEIVSLFKEIQCQSEKIFEMIRLNVQEMVGKYLSEVMSAELTHLLGREPYGRNRDEPNYRNGFYGPKFTLKGTGEVSVKVPRDRDGEYQTQQMEMPACRHLPLSFRNRMPQLLPP